MTKGDSTLVLFAYVLEVKSLRITARQSFQNEFGYDILLEKQDICAVRKVLRHRSELVMAASQHVQHMHKALTQMNLRIHHVISDITGTTGLAIAYLHPFDFQDSPYC